MRWGEDGDEEDDDEDDGENDGEDDGEEDDGEDDEMKEWGGIWWTGCDGWLEQLCIGCR